MRKLINRIPGLSLLISSLPASLAMSTSVLKALHCKLDIKIHTPSIISLPSIEIPSIHFITWDSEGFLIFTHTLTQNLVNVYLLEVSQRNT